MRRSLCASKVLGVLSIMILHNEVALAWGQFGHQAINLTAIKLIGEKHEVGRCMAQSTHLMKRLASTPDIEWKININLNDKLDDDLLKKRRDNDQYEHSLHFFEADAYVNASAGEAVIRQLPSGEFAAEFPRYRDMLKQNLAQLVAIDSERKEKDPENLSVNDVTDNGTATWRAQQLYRLGVKALKANDVKLALFYLGTMGHYVGDLSQPFHTTINFDGQLPEGSQTAGIHSEIDTGLLPGKKKGSKDEFSVFSDELIESTVQAGMLEKGKNMIARYADASETQVVPHLLATISEGYAFIKPIIEVYAKQCKLRNERAREEESEKLYCVAEKTEGRPKVGKIGSALAKAMAGEFLGFKSGEQNQTLTVSEFINLRLAHSAAFLSQLWVAAHNAAGSPALGDCSKIGDEGSFDAEFQAYAIKNYPRPNDADAFGYMPAGYVIERQHDSHTNEEED